MSISYNIFLEYVYFLIYSLEYVYFLQYII